MSEIDAISNEYAQRDKKPVKSKLSNRKTKNPPHLVPQIASSPVPQSSPITSTTPQKESFFGSLEGKLLVFGSHALSTGVLGSFCGYYLLNQKYASAIGPGILTLYSIAHAIIQAHDIIEKYKNKP